MGLGSYGIFIVSMNWLLDDDEPDPPTSEFIF